MSTWQSQRVEQLQILTLNGDPMNTLTPDNLDQLIAHFEACRASGPQDRPRAILLASAKPDVFSNGINPQYLVDGTPAERQQVFASLMKLIQAYCRLPVPVIADVNGVALAGGAVLATMADFVLVQQDKAKLGFSEVKVSIPVPEPIFSLLERRIGAGPCREMLVLGRNVDAPEMMRLGFAQADYTNQDDRAVALENLVGRILRVQPEVMAATLAASKRGLDQEVEQFLPRLASEFSAFLTDDFAIGRLRALLEKAT
jgi:methylglutaconyl-CoA hydratase